MVIEEPIAQLYLIQRGYRYQEMRAIEIQVLICWVIVHRCIDNIINIKTVEGTKVS